jgi:WD40 repeat protein
MRREVVGIACCLLLVSCGGGGNGTDAPPGSSDGARDAGRDVAATDGYDGTTTTDVATSNDGDTRGGERPADAAAADGLPDTGADAPSSALDAPDAGGARDAVDVPDAGGAPDGVDAPGAGGPDAADGGNTALLPWSRLTFCEADGFVFATVDVAISSDGSMVAAAKLAPEILVGGSKKFLGLGGRSWSLAFSPDGTLIAAGVQGGPGGSGTVVDAVMVWRVADGSVVWKLALENSASVTPVRFSPDGTLLAFGYQNTVRLVQAATGAPVGTYSGHANTITAMAFSHDGTLIGSSDSPTTHLWRVSDQTIVRVLARPVGNSSVNSIAFSPDGQQVVAYGDPGVMFWRTSDGQSGLIYDTTGAGAPVAYAPDGQTFFAGHSLYRASDRTVLQARTDSSLAAVYKPDSSAILLSGSTGTHFWAIADGTFADQYLPPPPGFPTKPDETHVLSPDGLFLARTSTTSTDYRITIEQNPSGQLVRTLGDATVGHTSTVTSIVWSPDGQLIASTGQDQKALLWRVSDGTVLQTVDLHASSGRAAFSPDGRYLATTSDQTSELWDVATSAHVRTFSGYVGSTNPDTVAFSPDGTALASSNLNATMIFSAADGRVLNTLIFPAGAVWLRFWQGGIVIGGGSMGAEAVFYCAH